MEKSIPATQTGKHLFNTTTSISLSVSTSAMRVSLVTGESSIITKMADPVEAKASTFQGNGRKKTVPSYDIPAYTDYNRSAPMLRKGTEEGQLN